MDFYEKNLSLLKEYRTPLYDRYLKKIEEGEWLTPCDGIEVRQAKDDSPIFIVKRDGQTVRLNSPYRPIQEAEKWASQFSGENMRVNAMLFGFGNGMFPQALLSRLQEDAKLFIYEPSVEIFDKALHCMDLSTLFLDERVFFFFSDINPEEFYDLVLRHTHWTSLATQIVCHHTGYDRLFPEVYRDFLKRIKKMGDMVHVGKNTQAFFSKRVAENMLRNLEFLKEGRLITDYVEQMPKDIPAIIVAAGPSLDKDIDQLKRAKGKSFIIAVDTAMRHLVKHGILPDAMVTIDAGKPISYMNLPEIQEIPLFCGLESRYDILKFHKGLKIWFNGGPFLGKLIGRYGKKFVPYQPGGSVATAAYAICAALEFKTIVLVGQDLAYQGDITHAGGQVHHILNEEHGVRMIEGIGGTQVKSRHDWVIYRDWFEESIQELQKKDDTRTIDTKESGAMIHGSELMSLSDVIDQYCTRPVDISEILQSRSPMFTTEEYSQAKKEVLEYGQELQEMKKASASAEADCKEALKHLKAKKTYNTKMNRIEKNVLETTSKISEYKVYDLLDIYMSKVANQYLEGVFVVSKDEHQDEMNMYFSSQMIFRGIQDAVDEMLPIFEEMSKQL